MYQRSTRLLPFEMKVNLVGSFFPLIILIQILLFLYNIAFAE